MEQSPRNYKHFILTLSVLHIDFSIYSLIVTQDKNWRKCHRLNEDYQVAVPTAFYEDETLNLKATLQHIGYLATQSIQSVLVGDSTGEQHSLTLLEKLQLLDAL